MPILALITAVFCVQVIYADSIEDKAKATYIDNGSGASVTLAAPLISNEVITNVVSYQPYLGPDADASLPRRITSEDGSFIEVPYFLENRGNQAGYFTLNLNQLASSDFVVTQEVFIRDVNGNGKKDSGETELDPSVYLLPGERISFILCAQIPSGISATSEATIGLSAMSVEAPSQVDEDNYFSVQLPSDEQVEVQISASTSQLESGGKNTWEANLRNDGATSIYPRPVMVDGSFVNGVLLSVDLSQENIGLDISLDFASVESARPTGDLFIYSFDGGVTWQSAPTTQQGLTHMALLYPNPVRPREEMSFEFCLIFENTSENTQYAELIAEGGFINQGDTTVSNLESNLVSVNILGIAATNFFIGPQSDVRASGANDVICSDGSYNTGSPGPAFAGASYWLPFSVTQDSSGDQRFELTHGFLQGFDVEFFQQDQITPLLDGDNDGLFETPFLAQGQEYSLWAKVTIDSTVPSQNNRIEIVVRMQEYFAGVSPSDLSFDVTRLCFVGNGTVNIINPQDNWNLDIGFDSNAQGLNGSLITLNVNFTELGGNPTNDVEIVTEYQEWIGALSNPANPSQSGNGPYPIALDLASGGTVQATVEREEDPSQPGFFRLKLTVPNAAGNISASTQLSFLQNGELEDVAPDRTFSLSANLTTAQHPLAFVRSQNTVLNFNNADLAIEKTAVRSEAYIGEPVAFRLKISNLTGTAPITNLSVEDFLPSALHYIEGSAKLDGVSIATDYDKNTQQISWDLTSSSIAVGDSIELTYATILTESSSRTVTNVATVNGLVGSPVQSQDSATIRVRAGLMTRDSILVGRVYWDRNEDEKWGRRDEGLEGVTIQLSDGRQVTTDKKGNYHVSKIQPGPSALRIVSASIPEGLELTKPTKFERGTKKVRMIHVKRGAPTKMDFRLTGKLVEKIELDENLSKPNQGIEPNRDPNRLGVISPIDGTIYKSRNQFTAEVAYPLTSKPEFFLNKIALGEEYFGNKKVFPKQRRIEQQLVALPLKPGPNTLSVRYKPLRGDIVSDSIIVHNVGEISMVEAVLPANGFRADGNSVANVDLLMKDRFGQLVGGGHLVEVEVNKGEVLNSDHRPAAEGLQIAVQNGLVNLRLSPANHAEERLLTVKINQIEKEIRIPFRALRTSWEVTGAADFSPTNTKTQIDFSKGDSAHLNFLAQGPIDKHGKWQATLGYDSRRDIEDNFDRGQLSQEENDRYTHFGDKSSLSNPYASRAPFYLRVESEEHQFLYGDYQTQFEGSELARHSRHLTGLAWKSDFSDTLPLKAEGFVAKDDTNSIVRRIPVSEVVGSIQLEDDRLVLSSEEIILETYQRNRPDRLLDETVLVRGEDYTVDYVVGRIYLKKLFSVTDENLNPRVFRVSYETESLESAKLTYGLRLQSDWEKLQIGATHYVEEKQVGNFHVTGVDMNYEFSEHLNMKAEVARSSDVEEGEGMAYFLGLDYEKDDLTSQFLFRRIDENFINRYGANIQSGKTLVSWLSEYQLNDLENISLNIDHESSSIDSSNKTLVEAGFTKQISDQQFLGGTLGYYHESRSNQEKDISAPVIGMNWSSNLGEDFRYQIGAQYVFEEVGYEAPTELDLQIDWLADEARTLGIRTILRRDEDSSWKPLFQLRAEHQISEHLTYSTTYGQTSLNSSSPFNVSHALNYQKIFSPELTTNFTLESSEFLAGENNVGGVEQSARDYISFGTGLSWAPEDRELSANMLMQYVHYPDEKTINFELELEGALTDEWSVIDRLRVSYSDFDETSDQWYLNHKLGLSYRPEDMNRWIFLATLESDLEERGKQQSSLSEFNSHAMSVEALWTPDELPLELAMRYTARATDFENDWLFSDLKVLEARIALIEKLNLAFGGRWGTAYSLDDDFWSYNLGLVYKIREDMEIELGYNFADEEGDSYRADSFDSQGLYMQMRMVFDEDWLRRFKRKE